MLCVPSLHGADLCSSNSYTKVSTRVTLNTVPWAFIKPSDFKENKTKQVSISLCVRDQLLYSLNLISKCLITTVSRQTDTR